MVSVILLVKSETYQIDKSCKSSVNKIFYNRLKTKELINIIIIKRLNI